MTRSHLALACSYLFLVIDPLTAVEPLHVRIDRLVAEATPGFPTLAAPVADDAEFLRRATLDLNGSIPTVAESRNFFADKSHDKRTRLIDVLLARPDFARHLQHVFDAMLMERRPDAKVPRAAWEDYLRSSFAANKPYDQLVREMLSSDGADPATRPAAKFLLDRDLDPTQVTRDISRLFLGRNIQCAQCHDHPNVEDYKQEEFFGLQAFYNRTFLFPNAGSAAAVIAEKADGEVSFTSVFDPKKAAKTSAPRMPGRKPVTDPALEKGKEYKVAPAKNVRPVPAYSRFARLGGELASADTPAFARTAANRLWATLMGRGLVHPLDLDHSANPPANPALLDLLAKEFAAHQFDIRWLLREISLSETYQRSSAGTADPRMLAAPLKPLSPEQLAFSILQATGFTDAVRGAAGPETEPMLHARLTPAAVPIRGAFATLPGEAPEFAATLEQTLFVKHGDSIRQLIAMRPGNLLDRVSHLPDDRAVEELFLSVLTRLPTAEEQVLVQKTLTPKDRSAALTNALWSMLASAEFRFNH